VAVTHGTSSIAHPTDAMVSSSTVAAIPPCRNPGGPRWWALGSNRATSPGASLVKTNPRPSGFSPVVPTSGKLPAVRVVSGTARGRRLVAPKGDSTRPTSDFVREAIFNSLGSVPDLDLDDATVLDLFAGTGALGIEALSRGAAHATFVEHDRHALDAIRRNLDTTGFAARATVRPTDATRTELPTVDLVFADPPYAFQGWDDLLTRLDAHLVVLESDRELALPEGWRVLRQKRYGTTVVTLTSPGPSGPSVRETRSNP